MTTYMFVIGILLEDVHVDDLLTHGTNLSVSPAQALASCALDDKVDSAKEVFHLNGRFLEDAK